MEEQAKQTEKEKEHWKDQFNALEARKETELQVSAGSQCLHSIFKLCVVDFNLIHPIYLRPHILSYLVVYRK